MSAICGRAVILLRINASTSLTNEPSLTSVNELRRQHQKAYYYYYYYYYMTDLRTFNKRITEVLSTYTDHNYKWTKKEVCFFNYRCKLMKEKWDHFKLHVKPFIKEDEQENQKSVLVSNFSYETMHALKKRRCTQHT